MAKLKSLKKRERERETMVEVLTQQQAAEWQWDTVLMMLEL